MADNTPGSPQTMPLSGTGVAPAMVTPTSLEFGTVTGSPTGAPQTVVLKNNLPTTLTDFSYSTEVPFAASKCGTTLASKTGGTISVTFSPPTMGPARGTLSVSDSPNNSSRTVCLSGAGD